RQGHRFAAACGRPCRAALDCPTPLRSWALKRAVGPLAERGLRSSGALDSVVGAAAENVAAAVGCCDALDWLERTFLFDRQSKVPQVPSRLAPSVDSARET